MAHTPYTYERPYRAPGVRLLERIATATRACGYRPVLNADDIIRRARRSTGLTELDDAPLREPLELLVESYETLNRLTPTGRWGIRSNLTHLVTNRLKLHAWCQQHPAIADEPIVRPLFILGLPRTGTTLLYNLLALDPEARPLMTWESLWPAPQPAMIGRRRDSRRSQMRWLSWAIHWLNPRIRTVHSINPDGPGECTWLLANTLVAPMFTLFGDVEPYLNWVYARDPSFMGRVYELYRRQLQLLQWGSPPRRWTLKSPAHLLGLRALLATFPDALMIQTHRDPCRVVASTCSLHAVTIGSYVDEVDCRRVGTGVSQHMATMLSRSIAARNDSGRSICDVQYLDLVRAPLETVERVYAHFGMNLPDGMPDRIRDWLVQHPQHEHGVHRYDLAQFGLTREGIREQYGAYQERFGIPAEPP